MRRRAHRRRLARTTTQKPRTTLPLVNAAARSMRVGPHGGIHSTQYGRVLDIERDSFISPSFRTHTYILHTYRGINTCTPEHCATVHRMPTLKWRPRRIIIICVSVQDMSETELVLFALDVDFCYYYSDTVATVVTYTFFVNHCPFTSSSQNTLYLDIV